MNYESYADTVIYAEASERAAFIRRTYAHLAGAVLAFIAVEWMMLQLPIAEAMTSAMTSRFSWLIVLGAFMGVSWLAERWANSETSPQIQYLGLGFFLVAQHSHHQRLCGAGSDCGEHPLRIQPGDHLLGRYGPVRFGGDPLRHVAGPAS